VVDTSADEGERNLNRTTTMSPKKTILRELSRAHERSGGSGHARPTSIPGFSQQPEKYQKAVNELLQARLIEGRKDEEGHMTIAVNAHRISDVRKALRPVWTHPAVLSLVLVATVVGVIFVM